MSNDYVPQPFPPETVDLKCENAECSQLNIVKTVADFLVPTARCGRCDGALVNA